MKKIDTVIFDMDGTILDTLVDLMDATNYVLEKHGMPRRSLEEVRAFVGNGIHKLIERAVPQGTDAQQVEQVFADFRPYYEAHCLDKTKPYDGILELMDSLLQKGYHLAIVSNKVDTAVKELSNHFFGKRIPVAVGEREGVLRKPAADIVNIALQELHKTHEDAVYVGDSEVDYQTAVNSEMPCISVLWGFRTREFLQQQGANCFVESPAEILAVLEEERFS